MTGTVKLVSAGGGSVSLATPSTSSNRTLTLPDADLTIPVTNSSTTLTTQGDTLYRDGSGIQRLAKGTAGQVLTMNSGATAPEWAASASNTPAWSVKLSGNFTTTDGSYVKITWDSEEFDTDSALASNKFTVPAGKGGYYAVMFHLTWSGAEDNEVSYAALYKNGSIVNTAIRHEDTGDGGNRLTFNYFGLHNLSATDYLEVFFKDGDSGESNSIIATESVFQGFKLL